MRKKGGVENFPPFSVVFCWQTIFCTPLREKSFNGPFFPLASDFARTFPLGQFFLSIIHLVIKLRRLCAEVQLCRK